MEMDPVSIIAQGFGLLGMAFAFWSFQKKDNASFFVLQALCGAMFTINFGMIGAVSGVLFNISGVLRGVLFHKGDHKVWKLLVVEAAFLVSLVVSLVFYTTGTVNALLSLFTYIGLSVGTYVMWTGSGKNIRYVQLFLVSPSWLAYNTVHFTIGGILCETFNIISTIISFIRYGKDGFEQ